MAHDELWKIDSWKTGDPCLKMAISCRNIGQCMKNVQRFFFEDFRPTWFFWYVCLLSFPILIERCQVQAFQDNL